MYLNNIYVALLIVSLLFKWIGKPFVNWVIKPNLKEFVSESIKESLTEHNFITKTYLDSTKIEILAEISGSAGGIAHITHLFGFIFGFFYLLFFFKINPIKAMFFPYRDRNNNYYQ